MVLRSILHPPPTPTWGFSGGEGTTTIQMLPPPPRRRLSVTMRDRSKNRKPLQRGRYLSVEAIQAVQALKRAGTIGGAESVDRVLRSKVRRLLKFDMMAVLAELQTQNEGRLALQVFEEVRGEHWYTPRFSVYTVLVRVLVTNGLLEEVEIVCSYLKTERFVAADIEGFNSLLGTFLEFGYVQTAVDCFLSMEAWVLEPDESTFRILIRELEAKGEIDTSSIVRQEAKKYFGGSLEFLEEIEETALT